MDVDGTLIRGQSQFYVLSALAKAGHIPYPLLLRAAWWYLKDRRGWGPLDIAPQRDMVMSRLRAVPFDAIEAVCRDAAGRILKRHLRPEALAAIRGWQAEGAHVMLVSASIDLIVEPLRDAIGADGMVATRIVRSGPNHSACIEGGIAIGPAKWTFLCDYADARFGSWRLAAAYGDSDGDLDLLSHAEKPVAVGPSRNLRRVARARGWEIMNWT